MLMNASALDGWKPYRPTELAIVIEVFFPTCEAVLHLQLSLLVRDLRSRSIWARQGVDGFAVTDCLDIIAALLYGGVLTHRVWSHRYSRKQPRSNHSHCTRNVTQVVSLL